MERLKSIAKLTNYQIYGSVLLFCILYIVFWGYEGSGNDLIEIVPVLKKMRHPDLYPSDFYIGFNESLFLHERSFLNNFLYLIGADQPILLFIAYFICLYAFILGLTKLLEVLGLTNNAINFVILLVLFIAPYTSVGANELFYNMPVGSCFAKTLAVWSLVFYFRQNIIIAFLLLAIATFFQVLVGFQIFLLIGTISFIEIFKSKRIESRKILAGIIVFCILSFPYLVSLVFARVKLHSHGSGLFDLLEFRIGHHFLIQYTLLQHVIIFLFLFLSGIILWYKVNRNIFKIYLLQGAIMLIYIVGTTLLKSEIMLQMQWFKTTIWIELFSIIALVLYGEKKLNKFSSRFIRYVNYVLLVVILSVSLFKQCNRKDIFKEEQVLADWARNNTEIKSLFVLPPDFTHFKTWSERSSWVDFKAISHQIAYLFPWYDRINRIYKIIIQSITRVVQWKFIERIEINI